MTPLLTLNAVLFAAIAVTSLAVAILWAGLSRGRWRRTLTGWSLMGLLLVIAGITGNATLSNVWIHYETNQIAYTIMYSIFEVILIAIGISMWRVYRNATLRQLRKNTPNIQNK